MPMPLISVSVPCALQVYWLALDHRGHNHRIRVVHGALARLGGLAQQLALLLLGAEVLQAPARHLSCVAQPYPIALCLLPFP